MTIHDNDDGSLKRRATRIEYSWNEYQRVTSRVDLKRSYPMSIDNIRILNGTSHGICIVDGRSYAADTLGNSQASHQWKMVYTICLQRKKQQQSWLAQQMKDKHKYSSNVLLPVCFLWCTTSDQGRRNTRRNSKLNDRNLEEKKKHRQSKSCQDPLDSCYSRSFLLFIVLLLTMVNDARSTSSLQVKSSHASTKKTSRSRTDSKTNGIPTEDAQNNDDDCLVQWGVTSSSEVKNRRMTNRIPKQKNLKTQPEDSAEGEQAATQDQPAHLVEEIDAIIALIIYNTYSKKHETTFSPQHRVSRIVRHTKRFRCVWAGETYASSSSDPGWYRSIRWSLYMSNWGNCSCKERSYQWESTQWLFTSAIL